MIDYIKGKLQHITAQKAIVEVGGIGYGIYIPSDFFQHAPQSGSEVKIFISTIIREDSHRSYGFLSEKQRELFEMFLNVSGVGPKTALAIVGHITEDDLPRIIFENDATRLSKIQGVGKKTAEKICLELKDKWKGDSLSSLKFATSNVGTDAIAALVHLGYPYLRAEKAVKKILDSSQGCSADILITESLKII
jgi:Holliday junction DNA helicase RuvA